MIHGSGVYVAYALAGGETISTQQTSAQQNFLEFLAVIFHMLILMDVLFSVVVPYSTACCWRRAASHQQCFKSFNSLNMNHADYLKREIRLSRSVTLFTLV